MADLVTEDARELRFVVKERHDAARQIDVPARQRKCVDGGLVDHGKVPRQIRTLGGLRETEPDRLDVPLQRRVAVDAHLTPHLAVHLLAELDFLRLAHQRELPLPGCRVGGTCRDRQDENGGAGRSQCARQHDSSPRTTQALRAQAQADVQESFVQHTYH
jgi:hypothetical protein